jgi:hypothetical protein
LVRSATWNTVLTTPLFSVSGTGTAAMRFCGTNAGVTSANVVAESNAGAIR